ncbi:hypothetical protein V6N13_120172 [Hibiscus sabdariffa]|uniref:Uncharacterized protein n=1 Tax=Hibiscus sabdariffa TaxID=183260 RepID=A0ABR2E3E6_9ROSI
MQCDGCLQSHSITLSFVCHPIIVISGVNVSIDWARINPCEFIVQSKKRSPTAKTQTQNPASVLRPRRDPYFHFPQTPITRSGFFYVH